MPGRVRSLLAAYVVTAALLPPLELGRAPTSKGLGTQDGSPRDATRLAHATESAEARVPGIAASRVPPALLEHLARELRSRHPRAALPGRLAPARSRTGSRRHLVAFEAAGVLRRSDRSFETAGVLHSPYRVWKAGLPVLNRSGRLHEADGVLRGASDPLSVPPLGDGRWSVAKHEAVTLAEQAAGVRARRAAPRLERGWFAGERATHPAWRVTVPASVPFGTWQVTLRADTGETIALVDRVRRVEGVGSVYDPNLVLSPTPSLVPLFELNGSGRLAGRIARVFDERAPGAFRPGESYVFPPSDPRFVQTSVYRGLTDTGLFAEDHGFPAVSASIPAYTNLADPGSGGEFNNAFYDPFFPLFGFGNGDGVISANLGTDLDVAAHEMGHHVFEVLVEPLFFSFQDPVVAMTEAVADTFSALLGGDPNVGESTIPGQPFLRSVDNLRSFPDDVFPDPHETGLIYAGANWDLIEDLGAGPFADILIAALPFLPSAPFPIDYRDALIAGDEAVTRGKNDGLIRLRFSTRGFDDLEFPPEFRGFLADGIPAAGSLSNDAFHQYGYFEFPGSRAVRFETTGTGDVDLLVAPAASFDPDDPTTFAISAGPTSAESIELGRFTQPSVDDDDVWLIAVADWPGDGTSSHYSIVAESDLPLAGIAVDGSPFTGSLDAQGELDFVIFLGNAGQVVRLEAAGLSNGLDVLVAILDPVTFEVFNADDDSGPGTDALIQGALLPTTGRYAIAVLSPTADVDPTVGTGLYRLALTTCPNSGPNADGDTLVDGCDDDDDDDGFRDAEDVAPLDPLACFDLDLDECDDCSGGVVGGDVFSDGLDSDGDGECDLGDVDDDNDGCIDEEDDAPLVPSVDPDLDFLGLDCDNCPDQANPEQEDLDQDGAGDACDNCLEASNPGQGDADGDGFGNACDCDFNQDGGCGQPDYSIFLNCFGFATGPGAGPPDDPLCTESDMNADDAVGQPDYSLFLSGFLGAPGP